jgi:hypothetical protein
VNQELRTAFYSIRRRYLVSPGARPARRPIGTCFASAVHLAWGLRASLVFGVMREVSDAFLLNMAEVSAALIGLFLVGVLFYV